MLTMLARNWWLIVLRGAAGILFGILAIAWPNLTILVLVLLFGAYALVDGISLLGSLIRGDPQARRNGLLVGVMGVLSIGAAVVAVLWPEITALVLLYVVAFWSIAVGVVQLLAAIRLRQEIEGEFWLGLGGVLAILFGLYLVLFPGAGLVSLAWLVGVWAIVFGIAGVALGLRLRGIANRMGPRSA
jgi:uncharacterized membrane protein HdeD (DUF308 family)